MASILKQYTDLAASRRKKKKPPPASGLLRGPDRPAASIDFKPGEIPGRPSHRKLPRSRIRKI